METPETPAPPAQPDILLAEDGESDARLILDILAYTNPALRVQWAADGAALLDGLFVQGLRPRLILLDIMMPGVDGLEVLYRVKSNAATRDIPVVMITSLEKEDIIVSSFKLGVAGYVTKPVHRLTFLDTLRSAGCDWLFDPAAPG